MAPKFSDGEILQSVEETYDNLVVDGIPSPGAELYNDLVDSTEQTLNARYRDRQDAAAAAAAAADRARRAANRPKGLEGPPPCGGFFGSLCN